MALTQATKVGSHLATYAPQGVPRTVEDKLKDIASIVDYGAVSGQDCTEALKNACREACTVIIPKGEFLVRDFMLDNVNDIIIIGMGGSIVQSSAAPIEFRECDNMRIEGVMFKGHINDGKSGVVRLVGCEGSRVTGCHFTGAGDKGALQLLTCSFCVVEGNTFKDAQVATDRGYSIASDVSIYDTNANISVLNNVFKSGGGYAVNINAHSPDSIVTDIIVSDNHIDGYRAYGVMAYRNRQKASENHVGSGVIITDNYISHISGANPESPSSARKTFGAGVYIQGWESAIVKGNKIIDVAKETTDDLLAAAGVGVANCGDFLVEGNIINKSGFYGIKVNDSVDLGNSDACGAILGNNIYNTTRDGIQVVQRNNVNVSNNGIIVSKRYGISLIGDPSDAKVRARKIVHGNTLKSITSDAIQVYYQDGAVVSDNHVNGAAQGIVFDNSSFFEAKGNMLSDVTGIVLRVNPTCSGGAEANMLCDNICKSGTGRLFVAAEVSAKDNLGFVPEGAYGDRRRITAQAATVNVSGASLMTLAFNSQTDVTALSGGYLGQHITFLIEAGRQRFVHSANLVLKGATPWNPPANSSITFVKVGATKWLEVSRSDASGATVREAEGATD